MSQQNNALAVMPNNLVPTQELWTQIKAMGDSAFKSGLMPSHIKNGDAAAIIMMRGYELGLQPMVAIDSLYVVNNKIGVSADMLLAAIRKEIPDAEIDIVKSDAKICEIHAKRPKDKKATVITYTIEEAQTAQLLGKDNWKKHPADMLFARCVSRMKRRLFNEVMKGLSHTPEELEDIRDVTPKTETTPVPTTEAAPVPGIKTVKNYAPQTDEEAKKLKLEQENKIVTESTDTQVETKPTSPTRQEVGGQIATLAKEIGYTPITLAEFIKGWKNKTIQQLTIEEMLELRANFEAELNAKKKGN